MNLYWIMLGINNTQECSRQRNSKYEGLRTEAEHLQGFRGKFTVKELGLSDRHKDHRGGPNLGPTSACILFSSQLYPPLKLNTK